MVFNDEALLNDKRNGPNEENNERPKAYRVDNDDNLDQKDLERNALIYSEDKNKPVTEGAGAGGARFGENNLTPAANDKNNPSQYAGNTNAYFDRTEPSEEHPENINFTAPGQDGEPDYSKAQTANALNAESPKPDKVERGNGENDRPHEKESYTEGTVDNDNVNIPGPNEVPDQQKVGEDINETDEKDDIEAK